MKQRKAHRLSRPLQLLVCGLLLVGMVPSIAPRVSAAPALVGEGLSLELAADTGKITAVKLGGKDYTAPTQGGFIITDAANDKVYPISLALSGSGDTFRQSGMVGDSGLELTVTYQQQDGVVHIDGTVRDTTGTDRLVQLEYWLPVRAEGMSWHYDIDTSREMRQGSSYVNSTNVVSGNPMNTYPWAAISDGTAALAVGIPMDPPLSSLTTYDYTGTNQNMVVRFNLGVSPKTTKFKSKADFGFVLYAPEVPETKWAFRSAAQAYYDMYPEYFEVRGKAGNWLFQHDYYNLEGKEDFAFAYNETPGSYIGDEQNGVISLQYTAPAEFFIDWPGRQQEPEATMEEKVAHLDSLTKSTKPYAPGTSYYGMTEGDVFTRIRNSLTRGLDGQYEFHSWFAWGVGWTATTNQDPDIPGSAYEVMMKSVENAQKTAASQGSKLAGVYIDNLSGGYTLNYNEDHFAYTDYPLMWDENKKLGIANMTTTYEYAKRVHDDAVKNGMYVLGNTVFPESKGAAKFVHLQDMVGSEVGDDWGWDNAIQKLRRTLIYRKGWALLTTNDQGVPSDNAVKEEIIKSSMVYGLYANLMGYRVDSSAWESCRYLFRRYTPIIQLADTLGWVPVTYATYADVSDAVIERYGDFSKDAILLTMQNNEPDDVLSSPVTVDLNKMGLESYKWDYLMAYDLLNNEIVPVQVNQEAGTLTYTKEIDPGDVAAIMVGSVDAVWAHLGERASSDLVRIAEGLTNVPKTIKKYREPLPDGWSALSEDMKDVIRYAGASADTLFENGAALLAGLDKVSDDVTTVYLQLESVKQSFDINVQMTSDTLLAIFTGMFSDPSKLPASFPGGGSVEKPTTGTNPAATNPTSTSPTGGNSTGTAATTRPTRQTGGTTGETEDTLPTETTGESTAPTTPTSGENGTTTGAQNASDVPAQGPGGSSTLSTILIGVCVGVMILVLGGTAAFLIVQLRKKKQA